MDKELLDNVKEKLLSIADLAYKGNINDAIVMMGDALQSIETLAASLDEETREHMIETALAPMLSAMEDKDGTLLADIITYELLELLNGM